MSSMCTVQRLVQALIAMVNAKVTLQCQESAPALFVLASDTLR